MTQQINIQDLKPDVPTKIHIQINDLPEEYIYVTKFYTHSGKLEELEIGIEGPNSRLKDIASECEGYRICGNQITLNGIEYFVEDVETNYTHLHSSADQDVTIIHLYRTNPAYLNKIDKECNDIIFFTELANNLIPEIPNQPEYFANVYKASEGKYVCICPSLQISQGCISIGELRIPLWFLDHEDMIEPQMNLIAFYFNKIKDEILGA